MASYSADEKIDIGRVLERAFRAIARNALGYLLLAFVLGGLPNVALNYFGTSAFTIYPDGRLALAAGVDVLTVVSVGLGLLLLTTFTGNLLNATLVRSVILDLSDRPADIRGSFVAALSLALPMLGLAIFISLGLIIGFMALIVPGIILFLMWIVAVPVLVEERRGVFGSMERSAELTRGSRWRILAVYFVILFIVGAASNVLTRLAALTSEPLLTVAANALGATVGGVVAAAAVASIYVELRTVKEGATTDSLADVFA